MISWQWTTLDPLCILEPATQQTAIATKQKSYGNCVRMINLLQQAGDMHITSVSTKTVYMYPMFGVHVVAKGSLSVSF